MHPFSPAAVTSTNVYLLRVLMENKTLRKTTSHKQEPTVNKGTDAMLTSYDKKYLRAKLSIAKNQGRIRDLPKGNESLKWRSGSDGVQMFDSRGVRGLSPEAESILIIFVQKRDQKT